MIMDTTGNDPGGSEDETPNEPGDFADAIEPAPGWLDGKASLDNDPVKITDCGKYVVVSDRWQYEIKLSRIKTSAHLLKWVVHLMDKRWISRRRLASFVGVVARKKGFEIYGV